jgi:general secretion pathway protein G
MRCDNQLSLSCKHRLLCLAETKLKAGKTTPWHKVRLSFILTLLLLFALVIWGEWQIYVHDVGAPREAVLKIDLQQLRDAIDQYKSDHNRAPNSLRDLVDGQHLKEIPLDPFTHKQDWVLVRPTTTARPDQPLSGIVDVHSNSTHRALDGIAYNTW